MSFEFSDWPMAYCAFDIGEDRELDRRVRTILDERWPSATYHYRWVSFWCPVEAEEFYRWSGLVPEIRPKSLYRLMPERQQNGYSPIDELDPDFAVYQPKRTRYQSQALEFVLEGYVSE